MYAYIFSYYLANCENGINQFSEKWLMNAFLLRQVIGILGIIDFQYFMILRAGLQVQFCLEIPFYLQTHFWQMRIEEIIMIKHMNVNRLWNFMFRLSNW